MAATQIDRQGLQGRSLTTIRPASRANVNVVHTGRLHNLVQPLGARRELPDNRGAYLPTIEVMKVPAFGAALRSVWGRLNGRGETKLRGQRRARRRAEPASQRVGPSKSTFTAAAPSITGAALDTTPKVVRAEEYDNAFRREHGWTGADGTYSFSLKDGRTLWLFSDTLLGDVDGNGRRALWNQVPVNDIGERFINNSAAIQGGPTPSNMCFVWPGGEDHPTSLLVPPGGKGRFWINDGVRDADGGLTVLLNRFEESEEPRFRFGKQTGLFAAKIRVVGDAVEVDSHHHLKFGDSDAPGKETVWGTAVLDEERFHFVYGAQSDGAGNRVLRLARVPKGQLADGASWRFYDGKGWSPDAPKAVPIATNASNEASIHRLEDGRCLWVDQVPPFGSIAVRFADQPEGPWTDPRAVWHPPESSGQNFAYNPKAHPELSDERGLLVSYNVNSFTRDDSLFNADVYHPRFVWVPWELLTTSADPNASLRPPPVQGKQLPEGGSFEGMYREHYHDRVQAFAQENAALASPDGRLKQIDAVLIGDSLTDDHSPTMGFHPELLEPALARFTLLNRGIGGDRLASTDGYGLLNRIDSLAPAGQSPRKVAVLVGVNDLIGGKTPDETIARYRELLKTLQARFPTADFEVFTLTRTAGVVDDQNRSIDEFNAKLTALGKELGVAVNDSLTRASKRRVEDLTDGLHPSPDGPINHEYAQQLVRLLST
jgi:lysophospholipase L1-like esterase